MEILWNSPYLQKISWRLCDLPDIIKNVQQQKSWNVKYLVHGFSYAETELGRLLLYIFGTVLFHAGFPKVIHYVGFVMEYCKM